MISYWYIFCGDRLLLKEDHTIPTTTAAAPPDVIGAHQYAAPLRLPALDGHTCRAARLIADTPPCLPGYNWTPLRACFDILPGHHYAMAGKARELLHWDANSQYCSACGAPMAQHTDISKRCTQCGKSSWPALTTAIIVAVTRPETDEILLVQSRNFRGDYMGLVAGFVETGETLEECVAREVMEETNIAIKDLHYVKSQPWPYPAGLMVGFRAHYAGGELRLQRSELNKGGWYRRDNMPDIPGKVSLARQLIDAWLEAQSPTATLP